MAALAEQKTESAVELNDSAILRGLAERLARIAAEPLQQTRIALWKNHNDLRSPARAVLYISPEGAWRELITLECEGELARRIETQLRERIYRHEHFHDDVPVTADWEVQKRIVSTGWGLEVKRIASTAERGAWHFVQTLHGLQDVEKITLPRIRIDEEGSQHDLQFAQDLFGDILNVRQVGVKHISFHLMAQFTNWRGLEEALYDMYEEPELIHAAMQRLTEGHLGILRQYEQLDLLTANADGTYHNSGGFGWSHELPAPSVAGGCGAKLGQMWGSAESQEMAPVGPAQHREFVLEYEKRLLAPFARTGYGCCEDLTLKLDDVLAIPHIRRLSISPWANVDLCAPRIGQRCIFSWKPNPAWMVGAFREPELRAYIRHTVEVCAQYGNFLEIILKDTHTCECHPERFDTWARIAREEILRVWPDSGFPFAL